jgi:HK97 family phage major capsid protein
MSDVTLKEGLGAAVTPEEWAAFVLEHLAHQSVTLASGATRIDTAAKQVHVPRLTDDGGVDWYGELEEISNDVPDGEDLVLTPKKIAALARLSNESVGDSSPSVLDATGKAMLRAIALAADAAIWHGAGGKQPLGILDNPEVELPFQEGNVDYEGLVRAAGKIRARGGIPDVAYVNPIDLTELQLQEDGMNRPLIQPDASKGMAPTVAGLGLFPSPAFEEGEAVVAQADQIVIAVRQDASIAFSTDVAFASDGTVARVIARLDAGVNDSDGLCVLGAGS